MNNYGVYFNIKNLGVYGDIPGIEEAMKSELVRVYNIYADKVNSGITDKLNEEFERLKSEGLKDMTEYNQFMADGYQKEVVDDMNKSNISLILDFYVDPKEVVFTGCLKADHRVTIDFYLKEI